MTAAPPTVQRQFNFSGLDRACLALVPTVKCLLACDEDRVLDLIADKQLVAFDLRGPKAEKRFPGIWLQSIRDYYNRAQNHEEVPFEYGGAWTERAIADILPAQRNNFALVEFGRILCVTNSHLHNLINARLLTGIGGDQVRLPPLITRASGVSFLTARRM